MFFPLLVPILYLHDDKVESVSKKKLFVLSLLCENFSEISNRKNDSTICITGDKNNHSLLTIHIKKMSPFMLLSQALKNFFERDIQPFFKCDSMMGQIRAFTSSEFNFEPGGSIFLSKQGAVRSHKISSIFFFFSQKLGGL